MVDTKVFPRASSRRSFPYGALLSVVEVSRPTTTSYTWRGVYADLSG